MAANNILPFAQGGTALVLTQSAYAADSQRPLGHQPGVARPDFANKQMRQVNAIAAGLAQFLADNQATDVGDDLLPAALSTMILNAIRSATLFPAGTIVWMSGTTAPAGTVKVNGALLTRTTYARLWAYAQTSGALSVSDAAWVSEFGKFSPGDGASNFRVPDLRGYSVRAWDDGRGIDVSRDIGSVQADQNASHTHGYTDGGHAHSISDPGHGHGVSDPSHSHTTNIQYVNESGTGTPWGSGGGAFEGNYSFTDGGAFTGISIVAAATNITIASAGSGIVIAAAGGNEARPKNLALMPVMFF